MIQIIRFSANHHAHSQTHFCMSRTLMSSPSLSIFICALVCSLTAGENWRKSASGSTHNKHTAGAVQTSTTDNKSWPDTFFSEKLTMINSQYKSIWGSSAHFQLWSHQYMLELCHDGYTVTFDFQNSLSSFSFWLPHPDSLSVLFS